MKKYVVSGQSHKKSTCEPNSGVDEMRKTTLQTYICQVHATVQHFKVRKMLTTAWQRYKYTVPCIMAKNKKGEWNKILARCTLPNNTAEIIPPNAGIRLNTAQQYAHRVTTQLYYTLTDRERRERVRVSPVTCHSCIACNRACQSSLDARIVSMVMLCSVSRICRVCDGVGETFSYSIRVLVLQ